jgi:DNA segregation ATPase FtsK/SpoIIIE, S-DNA-T family
MVAPSPDLLAIRPEKNLKERPSLSRKEQSEVDADPSNIHDTDFKNYSIPGASLLANAKKIDQTSIKKDLKRQAEVLEETLLSFGIEAKVGQINCGPTITSFEVHPAIGVKVQRIKTLDNDIALNMEAKSIRIIAPIPGKAAVGIEVPNSQPQEVGFKEMLSAYQHGGQKFHIPILLGQAVNGDYVMSDLTKMPHCIIAGATGSGKSVCINTIIMSILLNAKPDQIKLVMVDPKKVELTPYSALPHMLAPVITESQGAAAALNWLVKEMEKRYEILKLVGTRNIEGFNKRSVDVETEASFDREIPATMPYIVGIIDELADLMMVASQDIETPIARIAQMARAVGIHLILATQRPSREVITGLIKANFPTRISFKVASRINSQIILDETGAESLLGNGDMLFLPPGSSHLVRAQGAFIRDEDIQSVIQYICQQAPPRYVIQSFDRFHEGEEGTNSIEHEEDFDSLYEQAKEVVISTGNASTTFLQRKLKIGYARAASLMDQMERRGIVGPADGSKPRKIFARKGEGEERSQESGRRESGVGSQESE